MGRKAVARARVVRVEVGQCRLHRPHRSAHCVPLHVPLGLCRRCFGGYTLVRGSGVGNAGLWRSLTLERRLSVRRRSGESPRTPHICPHRMFTIAIRSLATAMVTSPQFVDGVLVSVRKSFMRRFAEVQHECLVVGRMSALRYVAVDGFAPSVIAGHLDPALSADTKRE